MCGCASAACCEPRYVVSSFYSGIRGIVTREDPRTLSPCVWLPNNNLISDVLVATLTSPPSCSTLHRSPLRRRQRLTIDAGHTDKHRRPRMASLSGCWHPVEWANTLLGMSPPLRTCRLLSAVDVLASRSSAVHALQLQNSRVSSSTILTCSTGAAVLCMLWFGCTHPFTGWLDP